jgi:hypothetical protein
MKSLGERGRTDFPVQPRAPTTAPQLIQLALPRKRTAPRKIKKAASFGPAIKPAAFVCRLTHPYAHCEMRHPPGCVHSSRMMVNRELMNRGLIAHIRHHFKRFYCSYSL